MTDEEHQIMQLAGRWWRLAGSMESTILDELGMTPTRYFQRLHQLLAREEVEAAYPVLVHRLRRRLDNQPDRPRVGTLNLD